MKQQTKTLNIDYFRDLFLIILSLLAIFGSIIYYFSALDWPGIILTITLTLISFYYLKNRLFKTSINTQTNCSEEIKYEKNTKKITTRQLFFLFCYLLFFGLSVYELFEARNGASVISPWQKINFIFFLFYFIASLNLCLLLAKSNFNRHAKLLLLGIHYLLTFSVALITYQIGYGFDPFIHESTMELISSDGFVLPKPPYYLGLYSLVVIFHKISGLTIHFLNQILVPLLSALFLPAAFFNLFNLDSDNKNNDKSANNYPYLEILFLLGLGFSPLILTTPQNLSYLFLTLTVLMSYGRLNSFGVFILAAATAAIHPLTGLPALAWSFLIIFNEYRYKINKKWQLAIKGIIFIFSAFSIPLALFLSSGRKLQGISINYHSLLEPLINLINSVFRTGQEDFILNIIYFIAYNKNIIFFLAISILGISLIKNRFKYKEDVPSGQTNLLFILSSLIIAYLASRQIYFNNLIGYEQSGYANRILLIIVIFFIPSFIYTIEKIIKKIVRENSFIKTAWLFFAISLITISLYLSYPRFDKYFNSRGYNTGDNDIKAVNLINEIASDSYLVLANQQVSAAALTQFGFNHYFITKAGPIYFYPIPTGGSLYQYYLNMVYKSPNRTNLEGAFNLTGVNEIYLVINKYWNQSGRIINEAKVNSNKWWTIDEQVYIFKFVR